MFNTVYNLLYLRAVFSHATKRERKLYLRLLKDKMIYEGNKEVYIIHYNLNAKYNFSTSCNDPSVINPVLTLPKTTKEGDFVPTLLAHASDDT